MIKTILIIVGAVLAVTFILMLCDALGVFPTKKWKWATWAVYFGIVIVVMIVIILIFCKYDLQLL